MELKSYQKEVIADLARYLELVVELQSPAKAYQALWNDCLLYTSPSPRDTR